ncbi:MAG: fasciclin domain-containing protein, partial [Roseovarius indicus]
DKLTEILTCHVVSADAMSTAIKGMVDDDGGMHIVPTVGGCELEARYQGDNIMLTDQRGQTINVTIADVDQSNGVIHVVDTVILPGEG